MSVSLHMLLVVILSSQASFRKRSSDVMTISSDIMSSNMSSVVSSLISISRSGMIGSGCGQCSCLISSFSARFHESWIMVLLGSVGSAGSVSLPSTAGSGLLDSSSVDVVPTISQVSALLSYKRRDQ